MRSGERYAVTMSDILICACSTKICVSFPGSHTKDETEGTQEVLTYRESKKVLTQIKVLLGCLLNWLSILYAVEIIRLGELD